jgi:hypothetical protein
MTPAQKRQRAAVLDVIKGSIDEARRAIKANDIPAHDKAMGTAFSFLEAYAEMPALTDPAYLADSVNAALPAETPADVIVAEDATEADNAARKRK